MYLCDVHTHTKISPDSKAALQDMAAAAAAAGLRELCVTDHSDLLGWHGESITSFPWEAALAQYREAKETAPEGLDLRLGIELGSSTFDPPVAQAILDGAGDQLDFVLGSFHNWIGAMDNIELYSTDFTGNLDLCVRAMLLCLEHTRRMIRDYPTFYDSLAHIAYPLRYAARDGVPLTIQAFEDPVRDIFKTVAETDHALEVNTRHGLDLDSWNLILRWFKEAGGELVTVGSDAHTPGDVGRGIPEALDIIQAAGFHRIVTFHRRKPVFHNL